MLGEIGSAHAGDGSYDGYERICALHYVWTKEICFSDTTNMSLVDYTTLLRVENNLLQSKSIRNSYTSMLVNIGLILFFCAAAGFFLYNQYKSTQAFEAKKAMVKNIPQGEYVWNNAVRNSIELG